MRPAVVAGAAGFSSSDDEGTRSRNPAGITALPATSGATLLRNQPDLFQGASPTPGLIRFRSLLTLHVEIFLGQALLGASQILLGVRRWYRYIGVRPAREDPR